MEKQKQSLYFPEQTLREISAQANRLDRSLSWTVQQAWRLAREEIRKFPPAGRVGETDRRASPTASPPLPVAPVRRVEDPDAPRAASAQVLEFLKGKFDRELAG
jgi:uncharacterized small protein (TIGR04563 family)